MDENNQNFEAFEVTTLFNTEKNFNRSFRTKKHNSWAPIKIPILISDNDEWNYTNLIILLNQLQDFTIVDHSYTTVSSTKGRKANFHFRHLNLKKNWHIYISISNTISVKVSIKFLKDQFDCETSIFASKIGVGKKPLTNYVLQTHLRFHRHFNLLPSSIAILEQKSLLLFTKNDFSKIFKYFCKKIQIFGYPLNEDTEMLNNYINLFISNKKTKINSFSDLKKLGMSGIIKLALEEKTNESKLQTFSNEDKIYNIIAGVFIMPQAFEFLSNFDSLIRGFILDTTWRILPLYVTSIITASFYNTSVPIGFAFGHGETKALYTYLLTTIQKEIGYNFEGKIFETDQHSSLRSLCNNFQIKQIFCYKHFLSNLKKSDYSYEIIKLTSCTSQFDFDNLLRLISEHFTNVINNNKKELIKINASLDKIGMNFFYDETKVTKSFIFINDEEKWGKYSLLRRVGMGMPSTTNTLESVHGHINHKMPRRNSFYSALFRIFTELNFKYQNINKSIINNYNYIKRKTNSNLKQKIDMNKIDSMCLFYETDESKCLCGENKLESSNYQIDIPCIHRLHKGAEFPPVPQIEFNFEHICNNCLTIQPEKCNSDLLPKNKIKDDFNYAVRTIKYFTNSKDEAGIEDFVKKHTKSEKDIFFIQNQPVDLIQLIEDGIYHFKT